MTDLLRIKYIGGVGYLFKAIINGLNLVVELQDADEYQQIVERYHFTKLSKVQLSLEQWEFGDIREEDTKNPGYFDSVIRNLSINVEDINITFTGRDRADKAFQICIHLDKFDIVPTDEKWVQTSVLSKTQFDYKLVNMLKLKISIATKKSLKEMTDVLENELVPGFRDIFIMSVLLPVDLTLKLTMNAAPLRDTDIPRVFFKTFIKKYDAKLILPMLHLSFDVGHYHKIMDLLEIIDKLHEENTSMFFDQPIRLFTAFEKYNRKLMKEYKDLLSIKYENKDKNTDKIEKRIKALELYIPSNKIYEINVQIRKEIKIKDARGKGNQPKSFIGSLFSRISGSTSDSPFPEEKEESYDTTKFSCSLPTKTLSADAAFKQSACVNSYQVSGSIETFKISSFFKNMLNKLFVLKMNQINYNISIKPLNVNSFKFVYSILNLVIIGYDENSSELNIINTYNLCKILLYFTLARSDQSSPFLSLLYDYYYFDTFNNKVSLNLSIQNTNIEIFLNFFIRVKELLYRIPPPSVKSLTEYASEKMMSVSDNIGEFIKSFIQKIELNVVLNRTNIIFPTSLDVVLVARFNKLHTAYVNIKELRLRLSFDAIQRILKILNDTAKLLGDGEFKDSKHASNHQIKNQITVIKQF
ncbi:hypothetical protein HZS_4639, partial [Henneguya salminicola]